MKKLFILFSIVWLLSFKGNAQTCPNISHNPYTDFNSSSNSGTPTTLWLNIHTRLNSSGSGSLAHNNDYIMFKNGTIILNNIVSNPMVFSTPIPSGIIIASSTTSLPVTYFDAAHNMWITKVPLGYSSSDIFISGAAITSSNGFAISGGGKQSEISGQWQSNLGSQFASSWFYGSACYQPTFTCSNIANSVASISSGVQAGTPANEEQNLVQGGSGGGGSNYTGSYSSTDDVTSCQTPALSATATAGTVISSGVVRSAVSLTITGGTGIYTFLWSNGATTENLNNIPEGTYSVTITDINGYSVTINVAVGAILPIQLVSFDAQEVEGGILFKWQTASEINNKCFCIERSYDCITFDSIGSVPGSGTSDFPHYYSFFNEQIPSRTTYYRLKQINQDGSCSYSEVTIIKVDLKNSAYQIYPSLVTNFIVIENHSTKLSDFFIELYNMQGERTYSAYLTSNTLGQKISLPVLPLGYYYLIIKDAFGTNQRFKLLATK